MAAMSNYLENKLIDHIFRTTPYTAPTNIYIALYTSATADDGSGTEVTGGSYARVSVAPTNANWRGTQGNTTGVSSGTSGLADNAADIVFTTATGSWGEVTDVAIMDAATAGNMLFNGTLSSSKTVDSGDTFKFNLGDLDITLA